MTSERPDTSTVRTALQIVAAAEDLELAFLPDRVYDLTATLLLTGTDLRPSDLPTVHTILRHVLGLRVRDDELDVDKRVLEFVRLVVEDGRDLRPYQRTDVLDALEQRWGLDDAVGSDDAPDEDES